MKLYMPLLWLFVSVFSFVKAEGSLPVEEKEKSIGDIILEHVMDSHDIHLWGEGASSVSIPLPVVLYTEGSLDVFMSSAFHHGEHTVSKGDRTYAYARGHIAETSGKKVLDISITKNVFGMFVTALLMLLLFVRMPKAYTSDKLPRGMVRVLEPFVVFVRDDIAKANIGSKKYKKYLPYLLTVFFFIWILNLLGLIPLGINVTGNIAVTLVLATITFLVTVGSGNKNYWKHIFATPGVPLWLYPIMIPVEIIGIFTKPFALMIRLFANITAGHIVILSFISLIFILKNVAVAGLSVPFALFISVLELLVAFLQAFIFTMLSALFIGMAVAEHEGHHH